MASFYSYLPLLKKTLSNYPIKRALEWGPGKSTAIMLDYGLEEIRSFEHSRHWFSSHKKRFANSAAELRYAELGKGYEEALDLFPEGYFDFAFVDGRHRVACLKTARKLVKRKGLVILHDCERPRYQEGIQLFEKVEESKGTILLRNSLERRKKTIDKSHKFKVGVGIKVCWGENYITYLLDAIYNTVDIIGIAFGPVQAMSMFKLDSTLDLIKGYPDPEKKIRLVEEVYPNITVEANRTLDLLYDAGCDFYIKLDHDQIPSKAWLAEMFEKMNPDRPILGQMIWFIKNFWTINTVKGADEYRLRGFPIKKRHQFIHPDFLEAPFRSHIDGRGGIKMKKRIHHYAHVFGSEEALMRKLMYNPLHWHSKSFDQAFLERKPLMVETEGGPWKPYSGEHPEVMRKHPFRSRDFVWSPENLNLKDFKRATIKEEFLK